MLYEFLFVLDTFMIQNFITTLLLQFEHNVNIFPIRSFCFQHDKIKFFEFGLLRHLVEKLLNQLMCLQIARTPHVMCILQEEIYESLEW